MGIFLHGSPVAAKGSTDFKNRHREPTGRANARPMTGSAKQSIAQQEGKMECSARNDVKIEIRDLAAGFARGLACSFRPLR
jgi:hypothetical protein